MAGRRTRAADKAPEAPPESGTPPTPDPFAVAARADMVREGHANVSDAEAPEAQEAEDATPQEGTEQEGQAPDTTTPPQDGGDDSQNDDALQAELKKARAEAAKYRKQVRDFEAKDEAKRKAAMSAEEQAAEQIRELQATLERREQDTRRLALEAAIAKRSNALGIVDADAAVKMLDTSALDFADDGSPDAQALDFALRGLLKEKPYLKAQQAPGSPANPAKAQNVGETDDQRRARLYGGGGPSILGSGVVSDSAA